MRVEVKGLGVTGSFVILLLLLLAIFLSGFRLGLGVGFRKGYGLGVVSERQFLEVILRNLDGELKTLQNLERVIVLESEGKHKGVWGKDEEFGIVQFKKETFVWLAEKAGVKGADWKNQVDQVKLANWAIRNGYGSLWSTFEGVD